MAFAPMLVKKTGRYPTEENHSQSTRRSVASLSSIRQIPTAKAAMMSPTAALCLGAFRPGPVIPIVIV
jgi:hypothetical protein